jgi:hypothetical protein
VSNIKMFRICAAVPFDYLAEIEGEGLSTADAAGLAALILSPSTQCEFRYHDSYMVPNDRGGMTTMYNLTIEGEEALNCAYLARIARALGTCGEFAQLHIAEYRDMEDPSDPDWHHLVPRSELSGAAEGAGL